MSENSFTNGNRPSPVPSRTSSTRQLGTPELSDTRKRQSKRDEAIRKKIENDLARKRPGARRGTSQQQQQQTQPAGSGRGGGPSASSSSRPKQGTVSALKPLPALTVPNSITVADASQLCAAKRTDCVLVVDEDEHLCGIFTAKDLAFRVIGDGMDPRTTLVSEIMTPNPMVTRDSTSATEALQTMVTKHFRHLPVCNEDGDVVGLLDITKVFQESLEKLEKAYGSSQQLAKAFEGAQDHLGGVENQALLAMIQNLRDRVSFPDLGSILDARTSPAMVTVKTTVRDAAKLMRERRTTAVCVMEADGRKIAGIFTSKDVVLRVIAAGLDARTCSVVRVMTPHPDTAEPTLSIQEALRKMHDGHYLNLPIIDEQSTLIGIVDVLKLTYAVLEQINTLSQDGSDNSGTPAWGRLFGGLPGDDETESVVSGVDRSDMVSPSTPARPRPLSVETPSSEVYPHDSASGIYDDEGGSDLGHHQHHASRKGQQHPTSSVGASAVPPPDVDDGTYLFKFVAPGGTVHRFQARYDSHEFIMDIIGGKLASDPFFATAAAKAKAVNEDLSSAETFACPDPKDFQVLYTDDDGDAVIMTSDRDVTDAVSVARKQGRDRVVLALRGGQGWDEAAAAMGISASSSSSSMSKTSSAHNNNRRQAPQSLVRVDEEDEDASFARDSGESKKAKKVPSTRAHDEDLVFGFLKKEQLLPASVALLAVAIVGVFAVSRSSGQQR